MESTPPQFSAKLSDELLARIVGIAADAIICVDEKQRITFFNDGASEIFGYSARELIGQPLELLLPDRFAAVHHAHVAQFGHSPISARQMGERSIISGKRKNGEEFPAAAAIAKLQSSEGNVYSVVLRDVTQQRRAEQTNRQLLEATEAAVKARDELLGVVSHDLRNPVNAVKMLAGAILRSANGALESSIPRDIPEHATVMLQAASQMDALIQDLLDVTRLEAGRMHIAPMLASIVEIIELAVATLSPVAMEKQIEIVVEHQPNMPSALVDPDRIMQMVSNLVGNAIKFSRPGSEVRISLSAAEGRAVILIMDEGPGIAPEELPFVFDRFWQSKRTNRSGAGLGLAIARGIVLAHAGDIQIRNRAARGAEVRISLPLNGHLSEG